MAEASKELIRLLHPIRFPKMSGKMAAIVGCILGRVVTEPVLEELVVTSEGFLLGRERGDCGCNALLGEYESLRQNWLLLLSQAGEHEGESLPPNLLLEAEGLFRDRVRQS